MHCTELVTTAELRQSVYQLRYACYRRKQSILEQPSRMFSDELDVLPNQFHFLQTVDGRPQASVRASVVRPDLGWLEAPVHKIYPCDTGLPVLHKGSFVEASRLCFAPQARRDGFINLVSHVAAIAEFHQVDLLVACPRLEHIHAYQSMFGFQPVAGPRPCFGASFDVQLMAVSRRQLRAYIEYDLKLVSAWHGALGRLRAALRSPIPVYQATDFPTVIS